MENEPRAMLAQDDVSDGGSEPVSDDVPGAEDIPSEPDNRIQADTRYYLRGFAFLMMLVLTYIVLAFVYMRMHGMNLAEIVFHPEKIIHFDYIGGEANAFSMAMEVGHWSLVGIICQTAYSTGISILGKQFVFSESLIRWVSTSASGWGIATSIVFSLSIITLKVGDIEITLDNAPIQVIIAISFILGFYHDEARNLLSHLRERITGGIGDKNSK